MPSNRSDCRSRRAAIGLLFVVVSGIPVFVPIGAIGAILADGLVDRSVGQGRAGGLPVAVADPRSDGW